MLVGIVRDDNIRQLVRDYVMNRNILPESIRNIPIGDWNVFHVRDMSNLFENLNTFNEPLGNWNVSTVRNMTSMFNGCTSFNQPLDNWDVSRVTEMSGMFYGCTSFNQPLDNWDVSRVTNMSSMFQNCTSFNQPLNNWDVSHVTNITSMFRGCRSLTINPGWQIRPHSEIAIRSIFLNTPLQGQLLQAVERPQPPRRPQPPQPQPPQRRPQPPQPQPQGVAFEVHNAFPELNFDKFMDIIRRDNDGASNFKDARYPLQPLITYINTDRDTTIVDTVIERTGERISEKTNTISDLNGEIKTRLNAYLSEHPETKDSVMEMIQFIMSQNPDYKDPYIRFLTSDCINAYGPRQPSCSKGVFERVFLINKSVLVPLCSDDTSSSASSESSCKPVYRELLGCFYPVVDLDALFHEWYEINNMEEGSRSPLANASEEERKEDFRRFVLHKAPRADSTSINKFIAKYENIFKTLITGGRRKRRNRKTKKTKRKSLNKDKRKSLKKGKRKTKRRY